MSISCCILAKNESERLINCINSVIDYVDEVVLVDNGSTDNTKIIAKDLGCVVIDYPYDDLDKARNEYLKIASSEWILVLDADECFTRESLEEINRAVENADENTMGFLLPRYEYIGDGKWAWGPICRLFRNNKDINYNNTTIHASVVSSIGLINGNILNINTPIHHFDILIKERTVNKRTDYTRRLLNEIEIHKGDIDYASLHSLIGLEYAALNKLEEAEFQHLKFINIMERNGKFASFGYILLAENYMLQGNDKMADEIADKLIKYCSDVKNSSNIFLDQAFVIKAEAALKQKDASKAINMCEQALAYNMFAPHQYINIASLLQESNTEKAVEYLLYAIKLNPYLNNSIIYKKGNTPNIFQQQNSFLSSTKTVFDHLEYCYRKLGDNANEQKWKQQKSLLTKGI